MLQDSVQLISVDDHVIEPPNIWVDRLPAKFRDRGPKVVEVEKGKLDWVYDGKHYPVSMQGSVRTRIFHEKNDEAESGRPGAGRNTSAEAGKGGTLAEQL